MLNDFKLRRGWVYPHFVYNMMPYWLYDALIIANNENLFLIFSTDMRSVDIWLGQLCSIINIHNLLSVKLESKQGVNCTAILVHLVGILSTKSLSSINRSGMNYPKSILQITTFENIKKLLSNVNGFDDCSSFISSMIVCRPYRLGTNSFDIISSQKKIKNKKIIHRNPQR